MMSYKDPRSQASGREGGWGCRGIAIFGKGPGCGAMKEQEAWGLETWKLPQRAPRPKAELAP